MRFWVKSLHICSPATYNSYCCPQIGNSSRHVQRASVCISRRIPYFHEQVPQSWMQIISQAQHGGLPPQHRCHVSATHSCRFANEVRCGICEGIVGPEFIRMEATLLTSRHTHQPGSTNPSPHVPRCSRQSSACARCSSRQVVPVSMAMVNTSEHDWE